MSEKEIFCEFNHKLTNEQNIVSISIKKYIDDKFPYTYFTLRLNKTLIENIINEKDVDKYQRALETLAEGINRGWVTRE